MSESFDYEEVKNSGRAVYIAGYLIYLAAILFGEFMFISLMSEIFEGWNPVFVFLAAVGAITTGLTLAVMPLAKDRWVVGDAMNYTSWGFWAMELVVLTLNAILAFDKINGTTTPWLSVWRTFSPASPLLSIVSWGVLFNMHPNHKRRQGIMNFFGKFDERLRNQVMAQLDSDNTRRYIADQAKSIVDQSLERQFGMMLNPNRQPPSLTPPSVIDATARDVTPPTQPAGTPPPPMPRGVGEPDFIGGIPVRNNAFGTPPPDPNPGSRQARSLVWPRKRRVQAGNNVLKTEITPGPAAFGTGGPVEPKAAETVRAEPVRAEPMQRVDRSKLENDDIRQFLDRILAEFQGLEAEIEREKPDYDWYYQTWAQVRLTGDTPGTTAMSWHITNNANVRDWLDRRYPGWKQRANEIARQITGNPT